MDEAIALNKDGCHGSTTQHFSVNTLFNDCVNCRFHNRLSGCRLFSVCEPEEVAAG